jgi:hypothetical protein
MLNILPLVLYISTFSYTYFKAFNISFLYLILNFEKGEISNIIAIRFFTAGSEAKA